MSPKQIFRRHVERGFETGVQRTGILTVIKQVWDTCPHRANILHPSGVIDIADFERQLKKTINNLFMLELCGTWTDRKFRIIVVADHPDRVIRHFWEMTFSRAEICGNLRPFRQRAVESKVRSFLRGRRAKMRSERNARRARG